MKLFFEVTILFFALVIASSSYGVERGVRVVQKPTTQQRIALVIGNSDYKNTGVLVNPVNDAKLIADSLKTTGFEIYGYSGKSDQGN